MNRKNQHTLTDHLMIHVLELNKWQLPSTLQPEDFWLYFFKEGKNFKKLPDIIDIPELRLAMKTLEAFSEREHAYHIYKSREDAIRNHLTREAQYEEQDQLVDEQNKRLAEQHKLLAQQQEIAAQQQKLREAEQARADKAEIKAKQIQESLLAEQASRLTEQENAQLELDRLKALLRQANIEPKGS